MNSHRSPDSRDDRRCSSVLGGSEQALAFPHRSASHGRHCWHRDSDDDSRGLAMTISVAILPRACNGDERDGDDCGCNRFAINTEEPLEIRMRSLQLRPEFFLRGHDEQHLVTEPFSNSLVIGKPKIRLIVHATQVVKNPPSLRSKMVPSRIKVSNLVRSNNIRETSSCPRFGQSCMQQKL